jgi:hypothetical protein
MIKLGQMSGATEAARRGLARRGGRPDAADADMRERMKGDRRLIPERR